MANNNAKLLNKQNILAMKRKKIFLIRSLHMHKFNGLQKETFMIITIVSQNQKRGI